jgi:cell division protein FtsI (penicillin-binding protein 3)
VPGIEIGGKTGTAHIAYSDLFHGSFYGFANDDEGHRYTIGVLVIKAKKENTHFASQSAVPVFGEIVEEMVKEGYLLRSGDAQWLRTIEGNVLVSPLSEPMK